MPFVVRSMRSAGRRRGESPARRSTSRSMIVRTRGSISWYSGKPGGHERGDLSDQLVGVAQDPAQPAVLVLGPGSRGAASIAARSPSRAAATSARRPESRMLVREHERPRTRAGGVLAAAPTNAGRVGDLGAVDDQRRRRRSQLLESTRAGRCRGARPGRAPASGGPRRGARRARRRRDERLIAKSYAVRTSKRAGQARSRRRRRGPSRARARWSVRAGASGGGRGSSVSCLIELVLDDNLTRPPVRCQAPSSARTSVPRRVPPAAAPIPGLSASPVAMREPGLPIAPPRGCAWDRPIRSIRGPVRFAGTRSCRIRAWNRPSDSAGGCSGVPMERFGGFQAHPVTASAERPDRDGPTGADARHTIGGPTQRRPEVRRACPFPSSSSATSACPTACASSSPRTTSRPSSP